MLECLRLFDGERTPAEVAANPKSLTGDYLSGRKRIPVPVLRRV